MRIYLGGDLDFYHPKKERWLVLELDVPSSLKDILLRSGIPLGEVHLVAINGEHAELETAIITDQDKVKLFSAVGGG